jgi:hypothetical protein
VVHVASIRLTLDLRVDGDQISGQAGDGRGRPESFSGWVGLIGVLDRLLERDPRRANRADGELENETGDDPGA